MFDWTKQTEDCCAEYCARLEDLVSSYALDDGSLNKGSPNGAVAASGSFSDAELETHLSACVSCRQALDGALLSRKLMRHATLGAVQPSMAFPARVMASVRVEVERQSAPTVFWRPLELLASRFAVAGAVILLALSVYLAEFAPPAHVYTASQQQTEMSATEVGAGMPEPPPQPANQDDVLTSLVETQNGF